MSCRALSMRRLSSFAPVALAVFVTGTIVPRGALVLHSHAGGDHAHVHAVEQFADEHEHGHDGPSDHHHHDADGFAGPRLRAPEAPDTSHAHWQHPFQLAERPTPPALAPRDVVARLALSRPANPLPPTRAPTRSRGPPAL